MTRDAFIAAHEHELMGMMLGAFMKGSTLTGAAAALYLRQIDAKVKLHLNAAYDDLHPKPPAGNSAGGPPDRGATNGQQGPARNDAATQQQGDKPAGARNAASTEPARRDAGRQATPGR